MIQSGEYIPIYPDGETCVESPEWDEHICQGCDGWVTDKEDEDEFCETCEMCKELTRTETLEEAEGK